MLNINIGGTKKWNFIPPKVQSRWKVLDIAGHPDFRYNINSMNPLPFSDNTVDNIYSSHTLEHVHLSIMSFFLGEMHRILKPKGLVRVVVPDVKMALIHYTLNNTKWLKEKGSFPKHMKCYPQTKLGHLMTWFYSIAKIGDTLTQRSGHNMVFDWETLSWYFKRAGFSNVVMKKYKDCSDVFAGLDFKRHRDVSLYMEAQK